MKSLLTDFKESIEKLDISKKDRILLAVSGGMDSVVLTSCASILDLDFGIAHANFQLRGEESERDEQFVRDLAGHYGKTFYVKKFDTKKYAELQKCSIQVAARNLRYKWFDALMSDHPNLFRFVFTAHHLDDNIETMLMHFFRGTGIAGLKGMPIRKGNLVRPLLSIPKSVIMEFAYSQNLTWVEDSSNASDDYTRNFFRNRLIPSLTPVYPEILMNLEKNLHRFSEAYDLYHQAVEFHKKKLLKANGDEVHIPILLLKKTNPLQTIIYEIIKDYGFSPPQSEELIRLMDSVNGKYLISSSHRIIKNRRWLIIAPIENQTPSHIPIEAADSRIDYSEGQLRIEKMDLSETVLITKDPFVAWLDADKIQFPLILRKWKNGDYFYPLGMKKKKKLARFFIDQKLSKTAKEKIWVIVMDSQIIWVVGQRIDNRFCIGPNTKKVLLINNISRSEIL
ncbi:MAG TPA: tRNA lysidine(34) synthetase TilS [Puia sp.]|nr:tRNA lysidine(34) synthetase TilS [Puia sp.]